MKPCVNCSTPIPGTHCPHCGGSKSRIPRGAVALLGLSLAAGGLEACAEYGTLVTRDDFEQRDTDIMDADRDGYFSDVDCDDSDASIYPGAAETAGDGVDSNCDGEDDPQA